MSRLGPGRVSADESVQAGADVTTASDVLIEGDTIVAAIGTELLPGITFTGDLNTGIRRSAADTMELVTGGADRWQVTSAGHLLAVDDNTYDIGASGATRPRNVYIAGTLTVGGVATLASGTVLTLPQINDTSSDHQYIFAVSELTLDRTVTLPLLTADDTFVFADFIQTLTNKTLTTPTIGSFTNATHTHQNAAGGAQLDHGLALTGLTDDDHTGYALLAGRSGGQSLIGGTASGDDLTLESTSNVTKGSIIIAADTDLQVGATPGPGTVNYRLESQGAGASPEWVNTPQVRLTEAGGQTFTAAAGYEVVTWDTEAFDTDSMHEGATNPSRITFNTVGTFLVGVTIGLEANASAALIIQANGATEIVYAATANTGGSNALDEGFGASALFRAAVNDYIEVLVDVGNGSDMALDHSQFWAIRLGGTS